MTSAGMRRLGRLPTRPPEPWSPALLKSLRRRARRRLEPMRALEPHQLEVLLAHQEYRCALSNRPLILPAKGDLDGGSWAYDNWLHDLSPVNYGNAAVLVRLNAAEPWERGNIVFVTAPWGALYDSFPDIAQAVLELRAVSTRLSDGTVPILAAEKYYTLLASI